MDHNELTQVQQEIVPCKIYSHHISRKDVRPNSEGSASRIATGYDLHAVAAWICDCTNSYNKGSGFRASGLGFRVWVWDLGLGAWGLGFGVWGLGFGVWGLGFGVWGSGMSRECERNMLNKPTKLDHGSPQPCS